MLKLYNTFGRKTEFFRPVGRKTVTVFTCGPSVYQKSHIGNFRTFLFEDVLVRYLQYSGYTVLRGMNLTDIEDKAIEEASKKKISVKRLTGQNIKTFIREMKLLGAAIPDYLPRASGSVDEAVGIIEKLIKLNIAYWHKGNVYFDPTKFPGFGKLYGLDMSKWPPETRRFHKDTYPGMRWNLGDFILWHGYREGDRDYWDTRLGRGRPSWNVQDPSMIIRYFDETLSLYCGGIDNLYRHHDYSRAILESIRPYPMARFWLHCRHLHVNGRKMSKSSGNIYYTDTLIKRGFTWEEIRFFLIYGHYRETLNYSDRLMRAAANRLKGFRTMVKTIGKKAVSIAEPAPAAQIRDIFAGRMDNDLDVRKAFDALYDFISGTEPGKLRPEEAAGIIQGLRETDTVLRVIY